MDRVAVQALLDTVEYRPGWQWRVDDHREGLVVTFSFSVPDARGVGDQVQRVHTFVPPVRSPGQFFDWLYWRLGRIEQHECDEWFRVDGRRPHDPHVPLDRQLGL